MTTIGGGQYFLDLTALGRQEEWEEPKGRITGLGAMAGSEKLRYPDEYRIYSRAASVGRTAETGREDDVSHPIFETLGYRSGEHLGDCYFATA